MMNDKWQEYLDWHNEAWKEYNKRHIVERLSWMPEERTLRMEYILRYHGQEEAWKMYVMNREFERGCDNEQ